MNEYQSQSFMCICFSVWGHSSSGLFTGVLLANLIDLSFLACCSFSSSYFYFLRLMHQMMQVMPVMHCSILQRQGKLMSPVLHPMKNTMNSTMGRSMARQNFLILSLHLKRRKQGRLKKEVHWLSHICAERLSRVSTMLLTSLFTLSTASLTALVAVLCSSVTLVFMLSTEFAIVDWVMLMAVEEVDFTESSAEFTKDAACACICDRLFCAEETMDEAVLERAVSAALRAEVVVEAAEETAPVVADAAESAVFVTVVVTEEMALPMSAKPMASTCTAIATAITMTFLIMLDIISIFKLANTISIQQQVQLNLLMNWRYPSSRCHSATQKGYRKSSGRQASMMGGEGRFKIIEVFTATYSTKRVNSPLLLTESGFSTAFVIWYWGEACVPMDTQQNTSCKF